MVDDLIPSALWYGRHARICLLTRVWTAIGRARLSSRGVEVGKRLTVFGWLDLAVHPASHVSLGSDLRINSGFARNAVGACQRLGLQVGARGRLVVGNRVGISNSTIVCRHRIDIGSDVLIGGGCAVYDTDFHLADYRLRLLRQQTKAASSAPIRIGEGGFIGAHSIVLKGVTIGEGAVIGAGSVVARDVPSYQVWAGNPLRFINCLDEGS